MPKPLDKTGTISDRLAQFAPRTRESVELKADVPPAAPSGSWPSREVPSIVPQGQISIKGPAHIIDRFKYLCESDRRKYFDMLEILMDNFEGK